MDHELNTATKYGLFWSGARMEDEAGTVLADGSYIYQPERFSTIFSPLFEKLAQLNDYCFNQLISSDTKLLELSAQKKTAAMAQSHLWAEELDHVEDQLPIWEDNVVVVAKAVPIVLLCSFVEWGLKLLTKEFCGRVPRKTGSGLSDAEFLLDYLQRKGELRFSGTSDLMASINSLRKIRNAFAHVEWDSLRTQLNAISLRSSFGVVSKLFERIENSA